MGNRLEVRVDGEMMCQPRYPCLMRRILANVQVFRHEARVGLLDASEQPNVQGRLTRTKLDDKSSSDDGITCSALDSRSSRIRENLLDLPLNYMQKAQSRFTADINHRGWRRSGTLEHSFLDSYSARACMSPWLGLGGSCRIPGWLFKTTKSNKRGKMARTRQLLPMESGCINVVDSVLSREP